jgi:dinuclear metal center YbgI/SA1388 family protein
MIQRNDLEHALGLLLQPERFKDYCPNGLQVEGGDAIHKVITGVTASHALIEAAVAHNAQAILVHHGLFWRGYEGRITGWLRQRIALLIKHNINLFAYHLPLDAHPELGNNAQLGARLGLQTQTNFGAQQLGFMGVPTDQTFATPQQLAQHIEKTLQRSVVCVAANGKEIQKIAWCSGGAQSYFEDAIRAGADAFITGEISEPQAHIARECGVSYYACGHHASERYGVLAVGEYLAEQTGVEHVFIDIDNPA